MKEKYKVTGQLFLLSNLPFCCFILKDISLVYARFLFVLFLFFTLYYSYKIAIKHNVINRIQKLEWNKVLYCLAFAALLRLIVHLYISIFGDTQNDALLQILKDIMGVELFNFYGIFVGPVLEELTFHGAIMNYCYNMSRKGFIISNILFGFVHCMNEPSIGIFIRSILLYSLLGGIVSYIYYRTKRIEYSVLIHMLANFLAVINF